MCRVPVVSSWRLLCGGLSQLSVTKVDQAMLRDYIAYSRRFVHPKITDEAERELIEAYLEV